jgi:hypothetical protein
MGEKAQCTGLYMSILSPFSTPHGTAGGFFNSLIADIGINNHETFSGPLFCCLTICMLNRGSNMLGVTS